MPKEKSLNRETAFVDGIAYFGNNNPIKNSEKVVIGNSFIAEQKFMFNYISIRDKDAETANALGYIIDLKIECMYFAKYDYSCKKSVKINDALFEIVKTDLSNDRNKIYVYLKKEC